MDAQVHGYDTKNVMIDLEYEVNIIPMTSWGAMGCPGMSFPCLLPYSIENGEPILHLPNWMKGEC